MPYIDEEPVKQYNMLLRNYHTIATEIGNILSSIFNHWTFLFGSTICFIIATYTGDCTNGCPATTVGFAHLITFLTFISFISEWVIHRNIKREVVLTTTFQGLASTYLHISYWNGTAPYDIAFVTLLLSTLGLLFLFSLFFRFMIWIGQHK